MFLYSTVLFRYAVHDMNRSAEKIYENAVGAPQDHSVIFLAHNGPTGIYISLIKVKFIWRFVTDI